MNNIFMNEDDEIVIDDNVKEEEKTRVKIFNVNLGRANFGIKAAKNLKISRHRDGNQKGQSPTFRVLVVEDDYVAQMLAQERFSDLGCEIDIATTGEEALRMFNDDYDLVLLDIGLPDMSGLEVCEKIRKNQKKHIHVIVVTANGEAMRGQSLTAGADFFMPKPYNFKYIENYIESHKQKSL